MDTTASRCSNPKEEATELENVESGLQQVKSKTPLGVAPTRTRTHEPGYENKITCGLFMTMLGFCLSFIVAEVIPLFLITLFTVIEYDVGDGEMAVWLVVSQFIAIGSIAPFVGPLVDLFGRKFMTLGSLLLVVVAMILLGTATNITGMLAMTILSGMGIGIQFLTVIAAVTELVPVYKRGITVGYIVMGFLPFAPASLYGQLLAEKGYRWIGLVVGSMALIAFAILITWYKPPPRVNTIGLSNREKASRLDYIGAVLGIGGVTTFLVGLNWGGQKYPWSSVHVITALTLGLVSLLAFGIWEKCGAKYPMFPKALAHRPRLFIASTFLCLTSGINYSAAIVFWIIQVYTVYGASFVQAGVYSLPIGFCISGGAIISAIMMTAFKRHIQWVLLLFCVLQTTGLGSMAAINPEDINTAWAPLVIGLIGVGGVLLPSQVIFSIISPDELIGTSVALSIVVRAVGQVVGVSMYYNIFKTKLTSVAANDLAVFALPALSNGVTAGPDGLVPTISFLITTLAAGPFSAYAHLFPGVNTPEKVAAIQLAGHNLYKHVFQKLYLVSIAWGCAACISCFCLTGISEYIDDTVAVVL